jgi:hypothetical protein
MTRRPGRPSVSGVRATVAFFEPRLLACGVEVEVTVRATTQIEKNGCGDAGSGLRLRPRPDWARGVCIFLRFETRFATTYLDGSVQKQSDVNGAVQKLGPQ